MSVSAKAVQPSFWSKEEMAGKPLTVETFLGAKGRRLPDGGGIKKATIFWTNIFDSKGKKIWFGDIDLEKAGEKLLNLSAASGPLYLLDETDGKFLFGKSPRFIRHIATVVVEAGNILYSREFALKLGIIKKEAGARGDGRND